MANLASILTDPNYVNANEATKRAIFDKFSAQDPNFTNANPATQDAIRARFGVPSLGQQTAPELPESLRPRTAAPEGIPGERKESGMMRQAGKVVLDVLAGGVRGAGSIGATLIRPFESGEENVARRQKMDEALRSLGADPSSFAYGAGKFGAEMAGTMGVGGALAVPVKAAARVVPQLASAVPALTSGGLAAQTTAGKIAAGAVTGAAGAGLIEPGSATTGAALGAAVPFVPGIVAKGAGKLADLRQIPKNKAAVLARASLGDDLEQTLNALRTADPSASVAEVTASIQNPAWQALVKDVLEKSPSGAQYLSKFNKLSHDEGVNALAKLAGGATAAEVRGTTEAAKEAVRTITTPMRDTALARANLGKMVAEYEAQAGKLSAEAAAEVQKVRDLVNAGNIAEASARLDLIKRNLPVGLTKYTYKGDLARMADEWASQAATASLDLGQGSRFAKAAADALRSVGIKPLESEPLIRSLKAVGSNPELAANDLVEASLRNIADDIAKWTSGGGIIDARALDAIRKNSVNATVAQLRSGFDATAQRNAAAGVLSRIKPVIDDAIESAGGKGYREYLQQYAKMSQKVAEKQLAGEALELWQRDKDAFVRLVQNESPDTVEKILGPGKYNIAVELAEDTLGTLQSQANKRLSQLAASQQASDGQKALATLLRENTSKFRLPSWLSFWGAAANKTISELEKAVGSRSMKVLAEAMQSPESAVNLLQSLPAAERNRILQLVADPSKWSAPARAAVTGGTAASINMLAPESSIENEFVR